MTPADIRQGARYTLRPSVILGRPEPLVVTVAERRGEEFFRVRDEAGELLVESIHYSDLTPAKVRP